MESGQLRKGPAETSGHFFFCKREEFDRRWTLINANLDLRSVSICVDLRSIPFLRVSEIVSEYRELASSGLVSFVRSAISCVRDRVVISVPIRFDAITDTMAFYHGLRVRFCGSLRTLRLCARKVAFHAKAPRPQRKMKVGQARINLQNSQVQCRQCVPLIYVHLR